ncbi:MULTISPECIES: DUF423 domain-containing protein [Thiorhodovibrio]|uniref:DUF423 domain-containing protein n=1 Tax=Thiorhodovibrio TaxID=61593 RepID=UPI001911840E|nr:MULTISPECIES: DUF423 domain-containing protein [Thiorhodovibrio]MBK5967547.1 hypothetical protein [Thiorhodovibrio winogradskyi]WPL14059.1 hypothetical protein Thiosp_03891 [Thiorhodovibrio litoralis]
MTVPPKPQVASSLLSRRIGIAGALLAGLAVGLGAFGAHGLKGQVSPEHLAVWNTASDYLAWHGVALLALAALFRSNADLALAPFARIAAYLLLAGILVFSGSLFLLVLTGVGLWGAVTPLGGSALILGWLGLAFAIWRCEVNQN